MRYKYIDGINFPIFRKYIIPDFGNKILMTTTLSQHILGITLNDTETISVLGVSQKNNQLLSEKISDLSNWRELNLTTKYVSHYDDLAGPSVYVSSVTHVDCDFSDAELETSQDSMEQNSVSIISDVSADCDCSDTEFETSQSSVTQVPVESQNSEKQSKIVQSDVSISSDVYNVIYTHNGISIDISIIYTEDVYNNFSEFVDKNSVLFLAYSESLSSYVLIKVKLDDISVFVGPDAVRSV